MSFVFDEKIKPDSPLDPKDLSPVGWRDIDTSDYRSALLGFPSDNFLDCAKWEARELRRWRTLNPKTFDIYTTGTFWKAVPGSKASHYRLEIVDFSEQERSDVDGSYKIQYIHVIVPTDDYGKIIKMSVSDFRFYYRKE